LANLRTGAGFTITPDLDDTIVLSKWQRLKYSLSNDPVMVNAAITGEQAAETASRTANAGAI